MPRDILNEFGVARDLLYWPKYARAHIISVIQSIEDGAIYLVREGDETKDITEHVEFEARHALEQINLMIDDQKEGHF